MSEHDKKSKALQTEEEPISQPQPEKAFPADKADKNKMQKDNHQAEPGQITPVAARYAQNQANFLEKLSPLMRTVNVMQSITGSIKQQQTAVSQVIRPMASSLVSAGTMMESLGAGQQISSAVSSAMPAWSVTGVPPIAGLTGPEVMGLANKVTAVATSCHNMPTRNFEMASVLKSAVKTPELSGLQRQMTGSGPTVESVTAMGNFVSALSATWQKSLGIPDIAARSMAAQNVAFLRLTPYYRYLELPRGGKKVVRGLSKPAAEKLTQTDAILFDPGEGEFYHKDTPEQKVTADEITVAESALNLLAGITLDELISFESQLFEDIVFALEHPVGKRIFEIIRGWTEFLDFDRDTYFHARALGKNRKPFLDQEMLKAPVNVSSHGRYNEIGKSCYYIADSLEGAVSEIRKHSGGTRLTIQVATIRPVRSIRLIDLSKKVKGRNNFIEHLRYAVDNEEGKIIKEYLLPNFVASCCKRLGIDGIKYLSTGYCCYVMWKDDYFEFVEGGRRIAEPE